MQRATLNSWVGPGHEASTHACLLQPEDLSEAPSVECGLDINFDMVDEIQR